MNDRTMVILSGALSNRPHSLHIIESADAARRHTIHNSRAINYSEMIFTSKRVLLLLYTSRTRMMMTRHKSCIDFQCHSHFKKQPFCSNKLIFITPALILPPVLLLRHPAINRIDLPALPMIIIITN